MIRIIAMIGDAGASARLRSAIAGSARLEFVRDIADLAERTAPPRASRMDLRPSKALEK
jgi:hypothetical protein